MPQRAEITFEVPFHDVDMMGVAWHGHYYKYFELVRTELFRRRRCDTSQLLEMGYALPVIDSHCRYIAPHTYGMRVRAACELVENEFQLKVDYQLTEVETGRRLAKGQTVQAVVRCSDRQLVLPVPAQIAELFREDSCV